MRLVDPSSYKNARTGVEWECLSCQHRFTTQWQFIHTQNNACWGYFHKVSYLRPYWLEVAQERGLNQKDPGNYPEAFQECIRRYESAPRPVPAVTKDPIHLTDNEVTALLTEFGI